MGSEQQAPMTVWCGGINADQDVSIRLVPNGINQQQVSNLGSREPLAVLMVHSTRLKEHSKYFQACLSQRWTHPDANISPPSMEFDLEIRHGLQVASYTDCFSRMYTPLRKNFKDVKSSLELLRVASQIEFHKLVDTICRYLSTILWYEEDELRIWQFSSCTDFLRSETEDLVARLQIGKHANEDYRRRLLYHRIEHSIHIALCLKVESWDKERLRSAQSLFEDLFGGIGQSEIDSAFQNDMVAIVSKEVKEMLESFHEDCRKHTTIHDLRGETMVKFKVETISSFKRKLKALCWALELLLKTQVAEEVIECLLHLELFFKVIAAVHVVNSGQPASKNVALRFCKLVIFIFQEVVNGRMLLGIPDRVLLIETWQWIDCIPGIGILRTGEYEEAVEGVFLTLPLQQQLELLQRNTIFSRRFLCMKSIIDLKRRNGPNEEDAFLQPDLEGEGSDSDSMET